MAEHRSQPADQIGVGPFGLGGRAFGEGRGGPAAVAEAPLLAVSCPDALDDAAVEVACERYPTAGLEGPTRLSGDGRRISARRSSNNDPMSGRLQPPGLMPDESFIGIGAAIRLDQVHPARPEPSGRRCGRARSEAGSRSGSREEVRSDSAITDPGRRLVSSVLDARGEPDNPPHWTGHVRRSTEGRYPTPVPFAPRFAIPGSHFTRTSRSGEPVLPRHRDRRDRVRAELVLGGAEPRAGLEGLVPGDRLTALGGLPAEDVCQGRFGDRPGLVQPGRSHE
jgi:hypothetical protein